ncbi:MAG TPA: hypothetical protein VFO78_09050 [Candidatus Limnocylindrales bacterium]|nr:hypothetical protein [Candidatus Limnocylindrales bacterium]
MNQYSAYLDPRAAGRRATAKGSPGPQAGERELSPESAAGDLREASRYLSAQGFRPSEAGSLTAYLYGLAPVEGGWTLDEIGRLLFVRHLIVRQLMKS